MHVVPKLGDMADVTIDVDNVTEQEAEKRIRELYDVAEKPIKLKGGRPSGARPGGNKPRKKSQMKLIKGKQ